MRKIKAISRERFNVYVDWTRSAHLRDAILELEWYADVQERVSGVVAMDREDEDYVMLYSAVMKLGAFEPSTRK